MYYVAYGSNMNLAQMSVRCPKSKLIGNGTIKGYDLIFNIHLDVVKSKNKNKIIPVVVWDIDDVDWLALDRYEGYPNYYVTKCIDVVLDTGEKICGIIYVMAKDRKGICPPYKSYFETCLEGYLNNNIDDKPLYDALLYSIENETPYNKYTKDFNKKKKGGIYNAKNKKQKI